MTYVQGYLLQLVTGKHWKPSPGSLRRGTAMHSLEYQTTNKWRHCVLT